MGRALVMRLWEADLPKDGWRLAFLLGEKANKFGVVFCPFGQLAKEIGVDAPRMSRLLKMLERETVAQRVGSRQSGTILLNPTFIWRGNAPNQQEAIRIWNEHRPYAKLNVVEPKSA